MDYCTAYPANSLPWLHMQCTLRESMMFERISTFVMVEVYAGRDEYKLLVFLIDDVNPNSLLHRCTKWSESPLAFCSVH